MENLDNNEPKLSCIDRCPYLVGNQQQPTTTEVLGVLCVSDPIIDARLRAYQARECAGIEVDTEEPGGTSYCDFRQQFYAEDGTPGARIIDEVRRAEQLRRLHSGLWQEKLAEATSREQDIIRQSVAAIQSKEHPLEDVVFARIRLLNKQYNQPPIDWSTTALSQEARQKAESYGRSEAVVRDVRNHDRHAELIGQGKTTEEAIDIMTAERSTDIERMASITFGMAIHQMAPEWF